jgi:hypothetical protein
MAQSDTRPAGNGIFVRWLSEFFARLRLHARKDPHSNTNHGIRSTSDLSNGTQDRIISHLSLCRAYFLQCSLFVSPVSVEEPETMFLLAGVLVLMRLLRPLIRIACNFALQCPLLVAV